MVIRLNHKTLFNFKGQEELYFLVTHFQRKFSTYKIPVVIVLQFLSESIDLGRKVFEGKVLSDKPGQQVTEGSTASSKNADKTEA